MADNLKFDSIKQHLDADTDSGVTAIHHTLGHGAFQASPGSHRHDGTDSNKIRSGDINTTRQTYQPTFTGTGLAYTGTPAVGTYVLFGNLCHFRIRFNLATVTNFGTGQYFTSLPFVPADDYAFRDGGLHPDGDHYSLMADAEEGTVEMSLWTSGPSGQDVPLTHNNPHPLTTTTYFYVSGTYEIEV